MEIGVNNITNLCWFFLGGGEKKSPAVEVACLPFG